MTCDFTSFSIVISERLEVDTERRFAMAPPFTVEKISSPAGIGLGPLDQ